MIPYRISMTIERPADVAQRKWAEFMREGHTEQGELWHQEMLPDHFTPSAKFKYGHQSRKKSYVESKKRLAARGRVRLGGLVDNVHSGDLMSAMLNFAVIRGFPSRTSIAMQGPRYISMRAKAGQPDKAKELTAVTPNEDQKLSEFLGNFTTQKLDAFRQPQTIKV